MSSFHSIHRLHYRHYHHRDNYRQNQSLIVKYNHRQTMLSDRYTNGNTIGDTAGYTDRKTTGNTVFLSPGATLVVSLLATMLVITYT